MMRGLKGRRVGARPQGARMQDEEPLQIPIDSLSPAALRGVVEAFVLREGTDYGPGEYSLADKVAQVLRQLERAEAELWYDPESRSVTIAPVASPAPAGARRRPGGQ